MQLKKFEEKKLTNREKTKPWISFKEWQKNRQVTTIDSEILKSNTRFIMGKNLPLLYFIIWIITLYLVLSS